MIKNVTDRVPLRFFKNRFRIHIGRKCFIFPKSHKKTSFEKGDESTDEHHIFG